jgi:hypothetical protein
MTLAQPLNQEHIVLVDMRAHATAWFGVGHHHVVHPPARQEAEVLQQASYVGIPLVDILHQQRPVAGGRLCEVRFAQRADMDVPAIALLVIRDQPGQRGRLAGQTGQIVRLQWRLKIRKGLTNQQGALLPVIAQEAGRRHAQRLLGGTADFDRENSGLGHPLIVAAGEAGRISARLVPRRAAPVRAPRSLPAGWLRVAAGIE